MRFTEWKAFSPEEIEHLFRIAFGFAGVLRHNAGSSMGAIANGVAVIEEALAQINSADADPAAVKQSLEDIAFINGLMTKAIRSYGSVFDACTEHISKIDKFDPFCTNPQEVIDRVRSIFPAHEIIADTGLTDREPTHIIYPYSALFALVHELVSNSIRHSNRPPIRIQIRWWIRENRFCCEIEDSGQGISKALSAKYVPMSELRENDPNIRKLTGENGLQIASRIIQFSNGLLLFRRSSALGGTENYFELRLVGLLQGNRFLKFEFSK